MKILWLSHLVPYPPAGGALQRAYHLLRHAAERHEVHLLALHQTRLLPIGELPYAMQELSQMCASVRVYSIAAERSRVRRALVSAQSIASRNPFDVTWLRSDSFADAVAQWRTARAVDLVHCDTIGLWPCAADWPGAAVVLGHHNVESDLMARRAKMEGRVRRFLIGREATKLRHLERRAAPRVAMNITVSALDAERLADIAPGARTAVVENGVDTDFMRTRGGDGTGLVFAGTLGWFPNRDAVDFLLTDIWPLLRRRNPTRQLLLIGRDPPAIARIADQGVHVTGAVRDVRPWLDSAQIFVCPLRIGGGTRLKVLDALAMSKPVVATAIGVEGLDLVDGTHYLGAETAEEFAAQVERLEADGALRARLAADGRRFVELRHDWRVIGRQLDEAYHQAARGANVEAIA